MKRTFAVLGLGNFGQSLARTLASMGHEVLVLDTNPEVIASIADSVTTAVEGDCRDIAALNAVGIKDYDTVFLTIGKDIQASILTTMALKEMGVKNVIAKSTSDMHTKILQKIGADSIIFPEKDTGIRVARSITNNNFLDSIELSGDYSITEVKCPSSWCGKTILDLNVRAAFGINILAIKNGVDVFINFPPTRVLLKEDILVLAGLNNVLNTLS